MRASNRCPKCQVEIPRGIEHCTECGESLTNPYQPKGISAFKIVWIMILTFFITSLALSLLFGPGTSEIWGPISLIVLLATFIFLMYWKNRRRSYSDIGSFTQELRNREAERKSPTPELTDEIIVAETDMSVSPICTDCGKSNPPEAVHCMGCGRKLSQSICLECETENQPEAKFCMGCGQER